MAQSKSRNLTIFFRIARKRGWINHAINRIESMLEDGDLDNLGNYVDTLSEDDISLLLAFANRNKTDRSIRMIIARGLAFRREFAAA